MAVHTAPVIILPTARELLLLLLLLPVLWGGA